MRRSPIPEFHADATLDCPCGLPLFPAARTPEGVRYECANAHARLVATPSDQRLRRLIENWLDKRASQLEKQHRRWEAEEGG